MAQTTTDISEYVTPGGFRVTGIWSKAGFNTCVRVTGPSRKHDDILFDCGVINEDVIHASKVLISHGHVDHIGSCIQHARARALSMTTAHYYVPSACVDALFQAKAAFEALDGHEIPMNIVSVTPGQTIQLSHSLSVMAFGTLHRVPSLGYALISRRVGPLKPEFANLSQEELISLRKARVALNEETESIDVVYTGDTTFEGLRLPGNEFVFKCPLLIMELTYLDGTLAPAHKHGHIHLSEVVEHASLFENACIVFMHISPRYHKPGMIRGMIEDALPPPLSRRCGVALHAFGYREYVTPIVPKYRQRSDDDEKDDESEEGVRPQKHRRGSYRRGGHGSAQVS